MGNTWDIKGETVKIENSSALVVMRQLEKRLSGHQRLSTWEALQCDKKIHLGERFSSREPLLER